MNVLRFIEILQSYGSRPARWPAAERCAMQDFAKKFEEARTLISEQAELDALLDSHVAPLPSEFLRARIMAGAKPAANLVTSKPANDRLPYRAIAAMLMVGIFTGVAAAQFSPQQDTSGAAQMLAQSDYTDIDTDTYDWLGDAAGPGSQ